MGQIVPEGGERAMDVPGLTALVAMRADQKGAAIEAGALAFPRRFARRRLDGARRHAARHRFADAFESPADHRALHDRGEPARRDALSQRVGPRRPEDALALAAQCRRAAIELRDQIACPTAAKSCGWEARIDASLD